MKLHALWKHPTPYCWVSSLAGPYTRLSEVNGISHWIFLTSGPWPLTLTYELDLDILPLDHHAKIQVCMSVRSAVIVVTHRHTHRRCQNYYTRHVRDVGCKHVRNITIYQLDEHHVIGAPSTPLTPSSSLLSNARWALAGVLPWSTQWAIDWRRFGDCSMVTYNTTSISKQALEKQLLNNRSKELSHRALNEMLIGIFYRIKNTLSQIFPSLM